MATITLLGPVPGSPAAYRNHSSFLLETGGHKILVDAGESCSRTLIELGIQPVELDTIIITHGHSDHTGGLAMGIQSCWIMGRERPLPIFLPRELVLPLTLLFNASYTGPQFISFCFPFLSLGDSQHCHICLVV